MSPVPYGARFDERGGRLRGVLDVLAGRYPAFLFGGPVGGIVPIFHFHQVTRATLEPGLAYLRDNGYRTIVADELAAFLRHGKRPAPRSVMLTFDDAWSSFWIVAGPLLKSFDMRAVVYAIPGRIDDASALRPTIDDDPGAELNADSADAPLVTWPELRALAAGGRVDVQSHTWSHSMIFSGPERVGVVTADYGKEDCLARPIVSTTGRPRFLDPAQLGHPLFPRRSRMSDALRYFPDENRTETPDERERAIEHEIVAARDELQARIGRPVNHVCLPWGVTSTATHSALRRLGCATAVANRLSGSLAAGPGTDPLYVKRLHSRHIFALPGRGRRSFATLAGR